MTKLTARAEVIKIITSIIGKKPSKLLNPLIDLYDKIVSEAIMIEAKCKDKLHLSKGRILLADEHAMNYSRFKKEYQKILQHNRDIRSEIKKKDRKILCLEAWKNRFQYRFKIWLKNRIKHDKPKTKK